MNPLLLPLVAIQGRRARSQTVILPEATGPTTGHTGNLEAAFLRVVVVGESTAAGCGADTHEQAFPGAFARAISEVRDRPVAWAVHGQHGATIRRVRHRLIPDIDPGFEVAVLLIGVNDVLARTPAAQWRDDLAGAVDALTARAEQVIVAGIPPFDALPALPRALRTYLAERGQALDTVSQQLCAPHRSVSWVSSANLAGADATFFARDGFHPSPLGYRRWALEVAQRLSSDAEM